MKGHKVVQGYFPWTAPRFYNQVLAFTNKLDLRLAHIYFPWTAPRFYNQVLAFTNKLDLRLVHIVC